MVAVARPAASLSALDAVAVILGVVVGAGIFKTPALVAATTGSAVGALVAWTLGGAVSLVGALCYAELAAAYPNAGGEYHFLSRALGRDVSFLFAWARLAVIQTGSIALQAFIVGDYLSTVVSLGAYSPAIYAAATVTAATAMNLAGVRQGKWTQHLLSSATVLGLVTIGIVGLASSPPPPPAGMSSSGTTYGLAMVFVLLTYGGWSEAAYLSAEMRRGGRSIARALVGGIGLITALYLLVNLALLRGLGVTGMAGSEAVAADLMRSLFGERGAEVVSLFIALAALSTVNGTVLTGARTAYAVGCDYPALRFLGHWAPRAQTPRQALILQGLVALGLVALGAFTRGGFVTMVEYTAPVFWLFVLLVGVSLLVLRRRDPRPRPFRVPLYPYIPIVFCLAAAYMLVASLEHTGIGALVGLTVLAAGLPLAAVARRGRSQPPFQGEAP